MTAARCLFCGRRAIPWHHVTGRPAPDEAYLDRALVVPLCRAHHAREHQLLRHRGIEFLPLGMDALAHRLARLDDVVARCHDHRRAFLLEVTSPYGSPLAGLIALLDEAALVIAKAVA